MSWRQSLKQGKYRNAPFYIEGHDAGGGRRVAQHEYPLRDEPYAEDLGRRAREYSLRCYVLGNDYMSARDALIDALEQQGPGTLVHPYLGARTVSVDDYRLTETTREGGMAVFTLRFVESGELRYPAGATDTKAAVDAAVSNSLLASSSLLQSVYNVVGLIDEYVTEMVDQVGDALADATDVIGDISGSIANVIRAPTELAAVIAGGLGEIAAVISEPMNALNIYAGLTTAGNDAPAIPATTPLRQQQAKARAAVIQFIQQVATAEAVRTSSTLDYAASDDAQLVSKQLQETINDQMRAVTDDALYQALRDLRVALVADLRERGAQLPSLRRLTLNAAQPALVLAYQLYGDAGRDAEIVNRNRIRHPGFVPGGQELEVLNG